MPQWEGKSKGTVPGYRIFIFLMKNLGLNCAYFLLIFVSFYYFVFSSKSTKNIYSYFRKRHGYSVFKSMINTYKNYFVFGQTIIDKVAVSGGLSNKFTFEFDGIENIHELSQKNSGGIMISGHTGNFELAQYFFSGFNKKIHVVTTDREKENLKDYLESVGKEEADVGFIYVKDDMSHIFEIHKTLKEEGLICFTGDRYMPGSKIMESELFGEKAKFPAGPFLLSSKLNCPVLFVYVMRERNKHYHLYARKANFTARNTQMLLDEYTKSIEEILKKYPLQWFNYYDFWE